MEIVSAAYGHEAVVVAIQVDDVLSTFNLFGITRHGDDVLEDDIVSQQVEVVLAFGEACRPSRMMRKKGPSAPKFELSSVYLVTCPRRFHTAAMHCADPSIPRRRS